MSTHFEPATLRELDLSVLPKVSIEVAFYPALLSLYSLSMPEYWEARSRFFSLSIYGVYYSSTSVSLYGGEWLLTFLVKGLFEILVLILLSILILFYSNSWARLYSS